MHLYLTAETTASRKGGEREREEEVQLTTYRILHKKRKPRAELPARSYAVEPGPDARENGSRRIHPSLAAFIP